MAMVAILMSTHLCALGAPTLSMINKAKAIVEEARYQLPIESGGMTLTQVSFDSKSYSLIYRYYFLFPMEKPSNEVLKERKLGAIHTLKGNPGTGELEMLKGGISFWYNYYNPDGTFLYAIKITPADIR